MSAARRHGYNAKRSVKTKRKRRARWTEEEVDFLRHNYSSLSIEELMLHLPLRSKFAIRIKASKIGAGTRKSRRWSVEEDRIIFHTKKRVVSEVAFLLGRSEASVRTRRRMLDETSNSKTWNEEN